MTSSTLIKKKSLKQLQKENMKITKWVKKIAVDEGEEKEKVEDKENEAYREIEEQMEVDDPEIIERRIRRDQRKNAWVLRTMAKKVSVDILEELVSEIPGRAVAGNILDEMLEMMIWRVNLKIVWSVLESDRKLQRMIIWRIENQRLEEIWLAEAMKKEERLKEARTKTIMFRNRVVGMDVDVMEADNSMVMEWFEYEQKEHEEITRLMEQLELEYGEQRKEHEVKEVDVEDVVMKPTGYDDEVNDILEHTILDKLLEEWVDESQTEVDNNMTVDENDCANIEMVECGRRKSENDCADVEIDECVQSANCEGGCDRRTVGDMQNIMSVCTVVQATTTTACIR